MQRVVYRSQKWSQEGVEVPIPSPGDEILIMAAHAFFENKFISLHELYYLTYLTPQITNWEELITMAAQYHWGDAFCQFVSIAATLADVVGLSLSIPASFQQAQSLKVRLPYMLPVSQTFAYSWQKLVQDFAAGQLRQIPRQLFTYSFVDAVWMYRKARRKQRKVQAC